MQTSHVTLVGALLSFPSLAQPTADSALGLVTSVQHWSDAGPTEQIATLVQWKGPALIKTPLNDMSQPIEWANN